MARERLVIMIVTQEPCQDPGTAHECARTSGRYEINDGKNFLHLSENSPNLFRELGFERLISQASTKTEGLFQKKMPCMFD